MGPPLRKLSGTEAAAAAVFLYAKGPASGCHSMNYFNDQSPSPL